MKFSFDFNGCVDEFAKPAMGSGRHEQTACQFFQKKEGNDGAATGYRVQAIDFIECFLFIATSGTGSPALPREEKRIRPGGARPGGIDVD
jgi:hypothetical protein